MIDMDLLDISFRDNIDSMFSDEPMLELEWQKTVSNCNYICNLLKRKSITAPTGDLKSAICTFIERNFKTINSNPNNQSASDTADSIDPKNSFLIWQHASYMKAFKTSLDGIESIKKNDYDIYIPLCGIFAFVSILNRYSLFDHK
jgi:hypothetical protein